MSESRGRLRSGSAAPKNGERVERLIDTGGVVVEQILSGELDAPVEYCQDHDEWAVVLEGGAEIEMGGERLSLEPGHWVFLPRQTTHRLLRTAAGTSWIAVHLPGTAID